MQEPGELVRMRGLLALLPVIEDEKYRIGQGVFDVEFEGRSFHAEEGRTYTSADVIEILRRFVERVPERSVRRRYEVGLVPGDRDLHNIYSVVHRVDMRRMNECALRDVVRDDGIVTIGFFSERPDNATRLEISQTITMGEIEGRGGEIWLIRTGDDLYKGCYRRIHNFDLCEWEKRGPHAEA